MLELGGVGSAHAGGEGQPAVGDHVNRGQLVGEQGEVAVGEGHRPNLLQQAVGGVEIACGDEIADSA